MNLHCAPLFLKSQTWFCWSPILESIYHSTRKIYHTLKSFYEFPLLTMTRGQIHVGLAFPQTLMLLVRYLLRDIVTRYDSSFGRFQVDTYYDNPGHYIIAIPFQCVSDKDYLDISTRRGCLKEILSIPTSQSRSNGRSIVLLGSGDPSNRHLKILPMMHPFWITLTYYCCRYNQPLLLVKFLRPTIFNTSLYLVNFHIPKVRFLPFPKVLMVGWA